MDSASKEYLFESITRLSYHVPDCVLSFIAKRIRQKEEKIHPNEICFYENRTSAILLVDISGFTKLCTTLNVENLSKTINDYFELIISVIESYGGVVLKFAGDAIFAEWALPSTRDETGNEEKDCQYNSSYETVLLAASCANKIVMKCCDYVVLGDCEKTKKIELNVHCGLGLGKITEMHAGSCLRMSISDVEPIAGTYEYTAANTNRQYLLMGNPTDRILRVQRQYLILGDPINQVARATDLAQVGEVGASSEVIAVLAPKSLTEKSTNNEDAFLIVSHGKNLLDLPFIAKNKKDEDLSSIHDSIQKLKLNDDESKSITAISNMTDEELISLREELSLYTHSVVKDIEDEFVPLSHEIYLEKRNGSCRSLTNEYIDDERFYNSITIPKHENTMDHLNLVQNISHVNGLLDCAELRTVYTIFIMPLISSATVLEYNNNQNLEAISLLNSIYIITLRELEKQGGQLRQFIVDDKGVVLIGTFGLRGSTSPHMISERGLPATVSIQHALEAEIDVDVRIGATLATNRVYCGIVGGEKRHEYSVLGPSVNLAARLMMSPQNPGILVDDNVRLKSDTRFLFNTAMEPVKAKGYDNLVSIFEPISIIERRWKKPRCFVGRVSEISQIVNVARSSLSIHHRRRNSSEKGIVVSMTKIVSVSGECGIGKSAMVYQALQKVKQLEHVKKKRKILVSKIVCEEGDEFLPFSACCSLIKRFAYGMEDDIAVDDKSINEFSIASVASAASKAPPVLELPMKRFSEVRITPDIAERLAELSHMHNDSQSDLVSDYSVYSRSPSVLTFDRLHIVCENNGKSEEFARFLGVNIFDLPDKTFSQTNNEKIKPPKESEIVDFFVEVLLNQKSKTNLMVLAIDELHWMDSGSWKVLEGLYEKGKNILLILISRDSPNKWQAPPGFLNKLQMEENNFWVPRRYRRFHHMHLTGISEAETIHLISRHLRKSADEIEPSFCKKVHEQSVGMPYFAVEILNELKKKKLPTSNYDTQEMKEENHQNGSKSVLPVHGLASSSLSMLFLRRLDEFSPKSISILQLCGLLDDNFKISDVCLVYNNSISSANGDEELITDLVTSTIKKAASMGLLVESYFCEKDGEYQLDEENEEDEGNEEDSKTNCESTYLFSNYMWKSVILNSMLEENKRNLHKAIADATENDLIESRNQNLMMRNFRHRRDSGDPHKTSEVAITIANFYDGIALFNQSLLLAKEALTLWSLNLEIYDEKVKGISLESLVSNVGTNKLPFDDMDDWSLFKICQLFVLSGRCLGSISQSLGKFAAFFNAYYIVLRLPTTGWTTFSDGTNPLAVFSGLLLCLKVGPVPLSNEEATLFEQKLAKDFVEVATKIGETAHVCRALAAQSQAFAKFGQLDRALVIQKQLKSMYSATLHSAEITKAYGSDRAAQNFGLSTIWFDLLGLEDELQLQTNFVLKELLPKMDLNNVHNTFMLVFPIMNTMKRRNQASLARDLFNSSIVNVYEEYCDGKKTFFLSLFKPILILFQLSSLILENEQDHVLENKDSIVEWVLREETGKFSRHMESPAIVMGRDGKTVVAEICLLLAKLETKPTSDNRKQLLNKGIKLAKDSLETEYSGGNLCQFARREAKSVLSSLVALMEGDDQEADTFSFRSCFRFRGRFEKIKQQKEGKKKRPTAIHRSFLDLRENARVFRTN